MPKRAVWSGAELWPKAGSRRRARNDRTDQSPQLSQQARGDDFVGAGSSCGRAIRRPPARTETSARRPVKAFADETGREPRLRVGRIWRRKE